MKKVKQGIVFFIVIFLFTTIGALYYYMIHRSFYPDCESIQLQQCFFFADKYGFKQFKSTTFNSFVCFIAYKIFGFGIQSLRVQTTVVYAMILFIVAVCCVLEFKNNFININYWLLPVVAFFVIIINPGNRPYFGAGGGAYNFYPYDMHTDSALFAVLGIALLKIFERVTLKKEYIKYILLLFFVVFAYGHSDLLFIVTFALPVLVYVVLKAYTKNKKSTLLVVTIIMMILLFLRFGSMLNGSFSYFFEFPTDSSISGYGGWDSSNAFLYGDSGFTDFLTIHENISIVFTAFLNVFNVDLSNVKIISVYTLMAIIRIITCISIIICSVKISITGVKKIHQVDTIEFVIALGIIFNMLFAIVSAYGKMVTVNRYIIIVLYYGTMLICSQFAKKIKNPDVIKILPAIVCICVLLNASSVWKVNYHCSWYEQYNKLRDFLANEQLGNGIAEGSLAPLLTAQLAEDSIVIGTYMDTEGNYSYRYADWVNLKYNYVIDSSLKMYDMGDVEKKYGKADMTYELMDFTIYYYKDGVELMN